MSQMLPLGYFIWFICRSKLNGDFIKTTMKIVIYEISLKLMYPKKLHEHHNNLPFLPETMKLGKAEKLVANLCNKKDNLYI